MSTSTALYYFSAIMIFNYFWYIGGIALFLLLVSLATNYKRILGGKV